MVPGQTIDGAPALLHDAPEFAPEEAPGRITAECGAGVWELVKAIAAEHAVMELYRFDPGAALARLATSPPDVLAVLAADKVTSVGSILRRGLAASGPGGYWAARSAFLATVSYIEGFHHAVTGRVPATAVVTAAARLEAAAASRVSHGRRIGQPMCAGS